METIGTRTGLEEGEVNQRVAHEGGTLARVATTRRRHADA
jgi:hypothetical protein